MFARVGGGDHQGTSLSARLIFCVLPRTNTWPALSELALTGDLVLA